MKLTKNLREAFVRAAMNDVPKIDYREELQKVVTAAAIAALPPLVAAAHKKHPEFIETRAVRVASTYFYVPAAEGWIFPDDVKQEIDQLQALSDAQNEARSALQTKLTAAANSVTTRKALANLLPEFEKYLPADDRVATLNLPAVANIMADFVKAGWPKGQAAA